MHMETEKEKDFKSLAHMIMEADKSKICHEY